MKKLEKGEKHNLRILSYISYINKNNKKLVKLSDEIIKVKKFYFNKRENNIKYEEYIFNGLPLIKDIKFKIVNGNSLNITWNINLNNINELKNENISYKLEMKSSNKDEQYKEIYKGKENHYEINNLMSDIDYEFKICCVSNDYNGPWSEIYKIKIENNYYELNKSFIIKSEEEKNKIIEWISNEGNIKNIKIIYRATENGDTSKQFFEKIKNKGPIISLIETKDNKKCGGFTKIDWKDINNKTVNDPNAFLFSLDNKSIYKIKNSQYAFGCYENYTLVYGNNWDGRGIYLYTNFFQKENKEDHSTRVYDVPSDYCLTGKKNFMVKEVEIFQIIYE